MKFNNSKYAPSIPAVKGESSTLKVKMLIVDDDPIASAVIKKQLELTFPDAQIDTVQQPVIHPGYHVYFLDNDFRGEQMARTLVREARSIAPSSLIVALSTTLDLNTLNRMVNDGCNAVFDKQNPQQSFQAKQVITNYVNVIQQAFNQKNHGTALKLLSSLGQLLREWNNRLATTR